MARMHTRGRGNHGSKRPLRKGPPKWSPLSGKEVEEHVARLHGEGLSTALIGLQLRDQYGVPNVRLATGKSVTQIVRAKGGKVDLPEDLANLMRRALNLQEHLQTHARDLHNRRALSLVEAKIRRLVRYYKRAKVLPPEWEYALTAAALQVR